MSEPKTVLEAPPATVKDVSIALLQGRLPLAVALAVWRAAHGLRLTDVSERCGYQPTAVSAMLHDPKRTPGVRAAVEALIGYQEGRDAD